MLDAALRLDLPVLKKLSRPLLLAPIVGAPLAALRLRLAPLAP